jgi:hypothetical protein
MIGIVRILASVLKGGCVRIIRVASCPAITGIADYLFTSVIALCPGECFGNHTSMKMISGLGHVPDDWQFAR